MTEKLYDKAVFIGRFQPAHKGHFHVIKKAAERLKDGGDLIVLVGSANRSKSIRNPLNAEQRISLLCEGLVDVGLLNKQHNDSDSTIIHTMYDNKEFTIHLLPLDDDPYNLNMWIENVQRIVSNVSIKDITGTNSDEVALVGHSKDHTSFYLKMFPQWDSVEIDNYEGVSSTDLREGIFENRLEVLDQTTPMIKNIILNEFEEFDDIRKEAEFVKAYKKSWANSPYEPIFSTVDAVIVQAGHVLLIERGDFPGKGQLALPGGYVDPHEFIQDAMVREVYEETRLDIPKRVFRSYIKGEPVVFDDPHRSVRGRTITHAFLVDISDNVSYGAHEIKMTSIRGGDDAASASWVPLGKIRAENMFEDHYFIIREMLRRNGGLK